MNMSQGSGLDCLSQARADSRSQNLSGDCNVCGTYSQLRCTGCSEVFYCGSAHQRQDWKVHKKTCKKFDVITEPNGQVIYKARRDLEVGTNIMDLKPLLLIPDLPSIEELTEYSTKLMNKANRSKYERDEIRLFPCFGCHAMTYYKLKTEGGCEHGTCTVHSYGTCNKCHLPIHDFCQGAKNWHETECKHFVQKRDRFWDEEDLEQSVEYWGVLRAMLLKTSDKEAWEAFLKLPIGPEPLNPERAKELDTDIKFFLDDYCKFKKRERPDAEVKKVTRILRFNSIKLPREFESYKMYAKIIFKSKLGRGLPHSCLPNCQIVVRCMDTAVQNATDQMQYKYSVESIRRVKAGDLLTINYDPESMYLKGLSLNSRSDYLQDELFCGLCSCPRCSDPTEAGTFFSAVKCSSPSCDGFLLPTIPTSVDTESPWTCTKSPSCDTTVSQEAIDDRLEEFEAEWENIEPENLLTEGLTLLAQYEDSLFHTNHFRILHALLDIAEIVIEAMRNTSQYFVPNTDHELNLESFKFHEIYLNVFERILGIWKLVQPGYNYYREKIVFFTLLLRFSKLGADFSSGLADNEMLADSVPRLKKIQYRFNRSDEYIMREPLVMTPGQHEEVHVTFMSLKLIYAAYLQAAIRNLFVGRPEICLRWSDSIYGRFATMNFINMLEELEMDGRPSIIVFANHGDTLAEVMGRDSD